MKITFRFMQVDCAKVLIAKGIKRDVKNLSGQTAFNVAAMTNNLVIIDLINKPSDTRTCLNFLNLGVFS